MGLLLSLIFWLRFSFRMITSLVSEPQHWTRRFCYKDAQVRLRYLLPSRKRNAMSVCAALSISDAFFGSMGPFRHRIFYAQFLLTRAVICGCTKV